MIGRRTEDELLRAATAMLAWGTGAAASFVAALLLQLEPAVAAALVAGGATFAAGNLRQIRLERGLTPGDPSHESGVMQSHISEIEAGKRNASAGFVGALALAFAIPVS